MADPHNLQRFVDAQDGVYDEVRTELRAGHKATHWMWFIFPQLVGLGRTAVARHFAIRTIEEARAYLDHPVLGSRLAECTQLLADYSGTQPIARIMGELDAVKLRSSMTLFAVAAVDPSPFQAVLDRYYAGQPDELTLQSLRPA